MTWWATTASTQKKAVPPRGHDEDLPYVLVRTKVKVLAAAKNVTATSNHIPSGGGLRPRRQHSFLIMRLMLMVG